MQHPPESDVRLARNPVVPHPDRRVNSVWTQQRKLDDVRRLVFFGAHGPVRPVFAGVAHLLPHDARAVKSGETFGVVVVAGGHAAAARHAHALDD